jgi:serine/threonine protein kinase
VKILDFGLAQTDPVLAQRDEATIPTTKWFQTDPGTVIGTLGYMSPEQLRGEPSIRAPTSSPSAASSSRWSRPSGRSIASRAPRTIAAILKDDLPRDELERRVPPEFQRIIEGCVEKNAVARSSRRAIWR